MQRDKVAATEAGELPRTTHDHVFVSFIAWFSHCHVNSYV